MVDGPRSKPKPHRNGLSFERADIPAVREPTFGAGHMLLIALAAALVVLGLLAALEFGGEKRRAASPELTAAPSRAAPG